MRNVEWKGRDDVKVDEDIYSGRIKFCVLCWFCYGVRELFLDEV